MLLTPGEYSQSKERLIARSFQQCRTRLKQVHSKRNPGKTQFFNGSIILHGIFNADRD